MERVTKGMLILTTLLVAFTLDVEGGRLLKNNNEQVDQPQNFFGGAAGGVIPGPGFATGIGFGPSGFYTFSPGGALPTFPGTPFGGHSSP